MKAAVFPCLLAALFSATSVLAEALHTQSAISTIEQIASRSAFSNIPSPTPALELRQEVTDVTATAAAVQVGSITTQWLPSEINGVETYVEVIYTQTFASIPDQLPTAGAGEIGYGTLKKSKRDIVARETGYAQPIALVVQHVLVTQYIQPVTEILVIETVTMLPNMTLNGTYPGAGNMTYNATLLNGTANGTTSLRNFTLPASLQPLTTQNFSIGATGMAV